MRLTRREAIAAPAALAFQRAPGEDAPPMKRTFSAKTSSAQLGTMLLPRAQWQHYPKYEDRSGWSAIPADARETATLAGAEFLGKPWAGLPATLYLQYQREGDRARFESVYRPKRAQLSALVVAECCEGKGRLLDEIANGVWSLCEESTWCLPAHISAQKAGVNLPDTAEPITDLFAADTASLLAWTDALVGEQLDRVSKLIRPRIEREVKSRVLDPCHERIDFWWMGLDPKLSRTMNNWNPWINSNWLTAVLLLERDPKRRAADVWKVLTSLDRFVDSYHDDGGCDEGPSYWNHAGGSMFECLELLHSATNGKLDLFPIKLVHEIGRYIYRVHIADDWYVNFADASARVSVQGSLIYRYGKRIADPLMMRQGAYALSVNSGETGSIARELDELFHLEETRKADRRPPLIRDAWLSGTQHMIAREKEGSTAGLYLAVQGGHNAESHNHNDVGNFVVYAGGKPVLIDVGVETYSAKTFSSKRYEIWTMQSAWHNLPTIGGVMQRNGRAAEAQNCQYKADDAAASLTLEIGKAWPVEAGIRSWIRTCTLDRSKKEVRIEDRYAPEGPAKEVRLSFITNCEARPGDRGEMRLRGGALGSGEAALLFDADRLEATVEEHDSSDARLRPIWGPVVRRIILVSKPGVNEGNFTTKVIQIGA